MSVHVTVCVVNYRTTYSKEKVNKIAVTTVSDD